MTESIQPVDADRRGPQRLGSAGLWLMVFALAMLLYGATACRWAQWQDGGHMLVRIVTGQLDNHLGLALVHPIQFAMGRAALHLLPFLEPAYAVTLMSGLMSAIAIANLVAALFLLTRRYDAALLAGAALAVAHTFWQNATYTECYAHTSALLTAEWLFFALYMSKNDGRYLWGLAFFNGLGVANHLLAALVTPVDVVVILLAWRAGKLKLKGVMVAAGLWLLGTLPYSVLVVQHWLQTGDLSVTLRSALFGNFREKVLNAGHWSRLLVMSVGYVLYNFPNLVLLLGLYGLVTGVGAGRLVHRVLCIEFAIYLIFAARYPVADQYAFFFPVYVMLALAAGLGLARLARLWPAGLYRWAVWLTTASVVLTPMIYLAACAAARSQGLVPAMVKNKPYRDGYEAFFLPWGAGKVYGRQMNLEIGELAEPGTLVLLNDQMAGFGVFYAEALGRFQPGLKIEYVPEDKTRPAIEQYARDYEHDALADRFRVVLAPYDRDRLPESVADLPWQRSGDLYYLDDVQALR